MIGKAEILIVCINFLGEANLNTGVEGPDAYLDTVVEKKRK